MESQEMLTPAQAVRATNAMRSKSRNRSRSSAWISVWSAVLAGVYVATWMTMVGIGPNSRASSAAMGLLSIIVIYSSLMAGARDRQDVRAKVRPLDIVFVVLLGCGIAAFAASAFIGLELPWWLGLALGGTVFAAMAGRPIVLLVRTRPESRAAPVPRVALTRSVRGVTLMTAGLVGASTASMSTEPWSYTVPMFVLLAVAALALNRAGAFGLERAGSEWSAPQWFCFGAASAISFGYALLVSVGDFSSPALGIVMGAAVAGLIAIAAALSTVDR